MRCKDTGESCEGAKKSNSRDEKGRMGINGQFIFFSCDTLSFSCHTLMRWDRGMFEPVETSFCVCRDHVVVEDSEFPFRHQYALTRRWHARK